MQGILLGGSAGQAGAAAQHIYSHASRPQGCCGAASQVPEGMWQPHHYSGHACTCKPVAGIQTWVAGNQRRASTSVEPAAERM